MGLYEIIVPIQEGHRQIDMVTKVVMDKFDSATILNLPDGSKGFWYNQADGFTHISNHLCLIRVFGIHKEILDLISSINQIVKQIRIMYYKLSEEIYYGY